MHIWRNKSKQVDHSLIVKALEIIIKLLEKILAKVDSKSVHTEEVDLNDLIDGVEVKSILKFEKSTLYRLKVAKAFRTVRIGKRDYYFKSEIESHVRRFKK